VNSYALGFVIDSEDVYGTDTNPRDAMSEIDEEGTLGNMARG
jgi:hypothetical protein